MKTVSKATRNFLVREDGAALVEYALLLVLVAIAAVLGAAFLGKSISKMFNDTSDKLANT
jgi:Flp pilus assembly pilin Flp